MRGAVPSGDSLIIGRAAGDFLPGGGCEDEISEPGGEGKVNCPNNGAVDWACVQQELPCPGPARGTCLLRADSRRADRARRRSTAFLSLYTPKVRTKNKSQESPEPPLKTGAVAVPQGGHA
jgi:hypothetical protein